MDEREMFEKWATMRCLDMQFCTVVGAYSNEKTRIARDSWLESARRADRKAREECIRIAKDIAMNQQGSTAADVLWALTRKKEE